MRVKVAVVVLSCVFMFGCGGGSNPQVGGGTIAAPTVSSRAAQGGAVIVSLTSTVQGGCPHDFIAAVSGAFSRGIERDGAGVRHIGPGHQQGDERIVFTQYPI